MHLKGNFSESGKITTDIAKIFALAEYTGHPYILLIEGAPGIGKTVLSKEIAFQWANGTLLKNERLVFLIYFRDPKTREIGNFESLINYMSNLINKSKISKSMEHYISSISGKGITLIFDGYDEYPEELRKKSYLSDVINRKTPKIQSCNIIITSRPSASGCLHNKIDLRVEILGFTKEHRKSYIAHALKDDPNAIQDLVGYLESNYSVDAYCHVPLSMAILVFLFIHSDYDKTELPTTQTAINYKFVRIIILRFIRRFQKEPLTISTFSDVPKPYKQILLEISELAFKALQEDNIVFSVNEIRDFCPSLLKESEQWNGLDLLKAVQYFDLDGNELSFNFLHFSVQELLASYHISLMSETNQIKLLKETFWDSRYFNTWIMYVALTKDQPFAFRHFLSGNRLRLSTKLSIWRTGNAYIGISKNMKENKIKRLHLFQCFTEAGNDDMCQYIGNLLQDGTIDLSGQTLSAIELYTLSSFLARCVHRQWSLLDLSNCYLDDENFERFYKSYASLTKTTVCINTVNLSSNAFTEVSASQIANLVLNFNVKSLVFSSNEIKDMGIDQATFTALLEYPNLVKSRFIEIQDEDQVNLVLYKKGLSKSIASEFFMLCYCTIEAYEDVCLHIKNNNSFLEMLINASSVSIFKTMLHSLINKMTFISTDFKLYVKTINSTNEEINSIVTSLASNVPLAVCIGESCLPLHLCNISNENKDGNKMFGNVGTFLFHGKFSIKAIHSMFCLFLGENDLNQIFLNGIILYDSFIDYVSPKCMSLNSLQLLNCYVHNVTISNTVANVLSQVLCNTKFLEHLNLSGCRLKTEHMKIILEALKHVVSIITISLSDNSLAKTVFDVLASVITCNRELKSIELSKCDLQESAIVSITKALENCTGLQSLDLSNNVIGDNVAVNIAILIEKCQSFQDLRLQSCHLHYAGIQTIVEAMVKRTCLHCIDLSDNAVSDEISVLIASVIANNKNLQKLNFSNCKLQSIGCQQLLQAMAKITVLRHVNLSNNLLTGVEVDSFALMIHQNIDLEYLSISGCCDEPKDFEKITGSLVTLKSLNFLDLSSNVINIISADNIGTIITNNGFLEDFDLSKCEFRKSAFLKIIIALQNIHYLKCLYLNSYSVGHEEATGISMIISNSPFLENVDLSNCNLTEKELKTILSSLRNHTSLKHFDISCNTITNHVANEIVDVIDSDTQLTYLNISDTDVQEYGILKIFKAVQRINTLKCINMSKCTISDKAAQAIADAISVNCMMEELVFTNNDFYETGFAMISGVLREAHTLKCLTIASNNIIGNITTKITEVISNNHITYFDLSNCDLQKSSCSSVLNSLILQAPNLQHFDLHCNNLNGTAETIAQLISVSYYLQYINLAKTLMQDEEVMIIVKAMQNINSLRHVDLTSYSIDDELALELQNTIDKNGAFIYFQFSRLCVKKIEVTIMTLGESIFSIVVNLQEISIHFGDCENDQVDAAASLIKNSPDLQYLQLESCSVLEIDISNIVIALARTTTLKYFSLINVVITDKVDDGIAAILENNTQLKHFKLVACKLTEKRLAKCIWSFNMTRLSHLVLSKMDNLISHTTRQLKRPICDSLTHLNLSNVHLNVTKLSFLSLPFLTKLQHLNLNHNPLTDESAGILSSVICNNHGLKHLDLCECKLQSEGIRVIDMSLASLTKLQYLNLSHNPLTDDSADILSSVICNNHGLKHLDLCECKLQSEGIKVIANSLQAIKVVYLDMSLNTIDIDTFNNNVMPVLFSCLSVVECLYLPYCELKEKEIREILDFSVHLKFIDFGPNTIPKDIISGFKNIILVSKGNKQICFSTEGIKKVDFNNYKTENIYLSLRYLNINNVIVDDKVTNIVANLIANSPELEHLEMAGGEWTFASAMKCFRAFQTTKKLIYLNLSNNSFTLTELLSLLTNFIALKFLHLRECGLKSTGIIPLTTLSTVTTLNYLDLSSNSIDDEAVDYLTVLIATNVGLEYLSFCNCKVSFSGIQNISSALKVTSSLEFLDINFSDVEGKSLDQVATLLPNYKHLKQLRLSNLVLDNNMFHQIQSSLPVIKELQRLTINNCVFTDRDISTIISLFANNSTLHELTLLNCEMSMKGKIKFTCFATALCLQCLKFDSITVTDIKHSPSTSLHCKYNLTDDDVVAVMIVNNYVGEFIMFKLIVNQNSLKVLSANTVTVRHLKVLHIKDCIFTDYYAHYVAFLITNNVATIQSFSLTSCEMSMIQRMIITKALCKLNIILLQHLNIKDILYSNEEYEANICLYSCFTITNCKLTDEIITAVMVSNKSLRISKLLINQSTLLELRKTLFVDQGNKKISLNADHIKTSKLERVNLNNYDTGHIFHALRYLNINNITVDDKVTNTVANLIANSPELEHLEMIGGGWTFTSAMKCFRAFQTTKKLIHLNLSNNSSTLTELLSLLTNFIALKFLHLHECGLKSTGIIPLTTLSTVTTLNYLDVSSNSIDDEAADYLAVLIATNVEIEHLNFCDCKLSFSGIQNISSALKLLSSLKFLDIRFNSTDGKDLHDDVVETILANSKHLEQLNLFNLVLDNGKFHQMKSQLVIKGLEQLIISDCIFTDEDVSRIISLVTNNSTLCELTLLNCEMSMKGKIKFTCFATALCLQCLKFDSITVTDIKHSPSTSLHCKYNLTDDDVVAVMIVNNYVGEFIMFKLIVNQNSLKVLSANTVTVRHLKVLHIKDCIFTDYYAHYVAFLITNNVATIQSFSLTSCEMSMIQRMIITEALSKLNIQHLNIKNILYNNKEYEARICLYSCFTVTNCKLTDEIITAVMVSNKSLRISKLLINQSTLLELRKTLFVNQGNKKTSFIIFHALRYLNVNNIIVDDKVTNTVANLIANSPELEHLEMIGGGWTFTSAMKCFRAFQTTKKLIYLNLSNNSFTLTELLSLLTNFVTLKFLHLHECGLKSTGIIPLTTLSTVTTLNYLDVSSNSIDDEAADYLAVLIATNVEIEHLNFCDCKLSFSGIQNISSALKLLSSLKFLDIRFNSTDGKDLHDDVVETILANSKHLEQLNLFNLVLDNGKFHQMKSQLVIKGLEQLIISDCIFTDEDVSRIISLVTNNSTLREVCLFHCKMSVKSKVQFISITTVHGIYVVFEV